MSVKNTCYFIKPILLSFFLILLIKNGHTSSLNNSVEDLIEGYRSRLPVLDQEEDATPEETIILFMKKLSGNSCKKGEEELKNKLKNLIEAQEPLNFVLPGFPFKSLNPKKVLSPGKFDLADLIALETLDHLCCEIEKIYKFGVYVGIVPDAIRITEFLGVKTQREDYQRALSDLLPSDHIKVLRLQDFRDSPTTDLSLKGISDYLSKINISDINTDPYLAFTRSELNCDFYQCFLIEKQKQIIFEKVKTQKTFREFFVGERELAVEGLNYDKFQVYLEKEILKEDQYKSIYIKILCSLTDRLNPKNILKSHVKECAKVNCEENCQFGSYISEFFGGYANHIRLSVNPRNPDVSQKFFFPLIFRCKETAWHNSLLVTELNTFQLSHIQEGAPFCKEAEYKGHVIKWIAERE